MSSTYDSSLIALLGAFAAIVIGGIISAIYFKNDTSPPKKPRSTQPPTSTESLFVVKESEFPANWFDGKEVFELEKRAIFSKVKSTSSLQNSRRQEKSVSLMFFAVMDIHRPFFPLLKTGRLSRLRLLRLSLLPHPREGLEDPRIPQCLPAPGLHHHEKGIWLVRRSGMSVSWLEL